MGIENNRYDEHRNGIREEEKPEVEIDQNLEAFRNFWSRQPLEGI